MFYLVGSRFYGTHRENSDWDYLGANTVENRKTCEHLGLQLVPSPITGGTHYFGWSVGCLLDILLVDNLDVRLQARDAVAQLPNVRMLSSTERHRKLREIIDASNELGRVTESV